MQISIKEKHIIAKHELIKKYPFLASVLYRIPERFTDAVSTAVTDGTAIYYNPEFLKGLSLSEHIAIILHELLHVVFNHPWRVKRLISHYKGIPEQVLLQIANVAADLAINSWLISIGFKLPQGALLPKMFNLEDGKQLEYYFKKLVEMYKGGRLSSVKVNIDVVPPCERNTRNEEDGLTEEKAKELLSDFVTSMKMWGVSAGRLEVLLYSITRGRVDWRALLKKYLEAAVRGKYSFTKPNKKYLYRNLVLPSLVKTHQLNAVVAIDTSGSVTEEVLREFVGEVLKILHDFRSNVKLWVVQCDADIRKVDVVKSISDIEKLCRIKGGGGTSYLPVFKWVRDRRLNPRVIVYLTDGYCGDIITKRDARNAMVIWAVTDEDSILAKNVKAGKCYGRLIVIS